MLVADAGYTGANHKNDEIDEKAVINAIAQSHGINVYFFTDVKVLIQYINNGSDGKREEDPITDFRVFSHGYKGSIEFAHGAGLTDKEKLGLTVDKINRGQLDPNAFSNTFSVFYSCNTGAGGKNSFAQEWVNITGGKTKAALGTTKYHHINRTQKIPFDVVKRKYSLKDKIADIGEYLNFLPIYYNKDIYSLFIEEIHLKTRKNYVEDDTFPYKIPYPSTWRPELSDGVNWKFFIKE